MVGLTLSEELMGDVELSLGRGVRGELWLVK